MANVNPPIVNFTGGILGGELHNRVDVPSYPNSCEIMENFRPRLQGPMTRRPPMLHIAPFDDHSKKGKSYDFIYQDNEAFLVRHTSDGFAFYLADVRTTIPVVSASLGAWSDQSTAPASSTTTGGNRWLDSNGGNKAIARKTITTSNSGTTHILAFEIGHGPLNIRIGSTAGAFDLMKFSALAEGVYRLAFTPASGTCYLEFWHDDNAGRYVKDTVSILPGPTYLLPTPYTEAALLALDHEQVRDVMYFTHKDYWPRRLERRGTYSWSIAKHLPGDGPWADSNITNITLAASNTQGEITVTASESFFASTDVGMLLKLVGTGQTRTATATSADVATAGIKVTGSGAGDSTSVPPGTGSTPPPPSGDGGGFGGDGNTGGE